MATTHKILLSGFLVAFAATLHGCGGGGNDKPSKPKGKTVIVGSGACDGQDTHCKDKKDAEKVMTFLTIDDNGEMHKWTEMADLPGLAAWFAVTHSSDNGKCLYVTYPGISSIGVFHWTDDGELPTRIQTLPVGDANANPVYADVSSDGQTLVVANYHGPDNQNNSTGASVQTFSIAGDCKLTQSDLKPHAGSSTNKDRQGAAHPHSTVVGRHNMLFVCDLGMDVIFTYNISSSGKLTELARTPTTPGSGPRHSVLHPTKDYLFVVYEMGSKVSSFQFDASGKLTLIADITTTPDADPKAYGSKAAEIAITPDGLHLYASNRAFAPNFSDTIAVFDVGSDGKLTLAQQVPCPPFPRGMMLMPSGKFLLVASQTNSDVASFKVDAKTGHLTATNSSEKGPWGAAAFATFPIKHNEVQIEALASSDDSVTV